MNAYKVCMLGAYAVGKTSLVARFVHGIFSEDYLTTLGVKIDRKEVAVEGHPAQLMLWDINGEDRFLKVNPSYVRGAHGCLLVVDGTRAATLDTAAGLRDMVLEHVGEVPMVGLVNKNDLAADWALDLPAVEARLPGCPVLSTSAKTGDAVERAFSELARRL